MSRKKSRRIRAALACAPCTDASTSATPIAALPLGALLLAGSLGAMAQTAPVEGKALQAVTVKEKAEAAEGKDALRATTSRIGKGEQELRDIPQSVTVVTEKLMDDRNLDTMKQALRNTSGISFMAAEGGEEDIRIRGFSLAATGDIFVDGMRDPAFYDRDTFNLDRLEVMRGSASMLFGRGSTGGAVNMVNKVPRLIDENQLDVTLGSHGYRRVVGDFNKQTGESSALRISTMNTVAHNDGAGNKLDKSGVAGSYRWGIGERDEFTASLYYLDNNNGINYGMPWIRSSASASAAQTGLLPVSPSTYYGLGSDYNKGSAAYGTFTHLHRFDADTNLRTQVRQGRYERDQRASTIRLTSGTYLDNLTSASPLTRATQNKIQNFDGTFIQSDFSSKFNAMGMRHEVLAGADYARESKVVYGARTAAQGGVDISKPGTTLGNPNDGAWVNEATRLLRPTSAYVSNAWGMYAQDLVQVAPYWKVLAGLRYDNLVGNYDTFTIPTTASGPVTTASYRMKVSEWSKRVGAMFQPNELQSYHFSAATSFNTSGDAYSLSAQNQNIPPEQSVNIEFGAKLDSPSKQFSTRLAVFRSTKLHERNTDPLVNLVTLSGKRHAAGFEVDITGRITPKWEVYGSYMWLPVAKIDIGVAGSEGQGTRPSLSPKHSGTFWNTYQLDSKWRVGAGVTFRSQQTPPRNPGWAAPGFATVDLMTEYKYSEQMTFKLNVSNVANKLYAESLYSAHYIPGAGRLVMLTGSLKF